MITDFPKLILAAELRVAAALFGIYTQLVEEVWEGGFFIGVRSLRNSVVAGM
jgi:hypothetical protein